MANATSLLYTSVSRIRSMQSFLSYSKFTRTPYCLRRRCGVVWLNIQFNQDDRHSPQKETETKKMAIPRLPEGTEASLSSLGRFHRRHVRRACESCRQRKTKCTGDKSGCRNCREAGIICCYTDGKREKSKRCVPSTFLLYSHITKDMHKTTCNSISQSPNI